MSLRRNSVPRGTPLSHHGAHAPSGGVNGVLDCTSECRAKEHALLVLSSAYLGNLKLLRHCASVCGNPVHIQDPMGRNALHVASSQGHLHLIQWLVGKKRVKVDLSDWESKWTALHRSAYYGQLGVAALLTKHGADLNTTDRDGWSPLSILNADRESMKASLGVAAVNVYTWGRNPNDTLGHDRSRKHPEKLELSLSPTNRIIKVVLCKFHSVFLSCEGQVLSCGHGPGGRLGHDSEQSIVTPRLVKAMERLCCVGIAAARDHTVFLTKSGAVYTCGLNDAHQLGHGSNPANAPANYLAPKQVRSLKSKHVIAVGAGRYHTAMSTDSEVYTVGKNLGQLGYEKTSDTQVAPHAVAGINLEDGDVITHMSVSDSATAVLTRKNHVFVCTDFIVKHIRLSFLDKLKCIQFEVCASLSDRDYLRKIETEPTKLLMLDSEHKMWLWEPTRRGSFPNTFPGLAKYNVAHFSLGKSLTIVTNEGEVYRGNGSVSKPLNLQRVHNIQNASAVFADFKANNFAYLQNVYGSPSLPSLSPSTLTSDLSSLLEESCLPDSVSDIKIEVAGECFLAHKFILGCRMEDFMSKLVPSDKDHYSEPSQPPSFVIKAGKKFENPDVFNAFLHYIYGSHIRLLPPPNFLLGPHVDHSVVAGSRGVGTGGPEGVESTPDTSFTSLDENDLTEEYDRFYVSMEQQHDDWIDMESIEHPVITGQSTPRKKSDSRPPVATVEHLNRSWSEPEKVIQLSERRVELRLLQMLASTFDLTSLKKMLEEIMPHLYKPRTLLSPRPRLRRLNEFSDLTLLSKDGKAIHCHRCVLVARSEYFRAMLLMGWKESSDDLKSLSMPVGYKVLRAVIDFIYTDEFSASIKGAEMVEWVMAVLVMADQLLLTRLKELCEFSLATILNLKNAVEFLEFAETYSALQLKKSSLQFICVNASCFLESRSLDNIDTSLLEELSQSYRSLILPNTKRVIKFPEPSFDMLPESYFHDDGAEEAGIESGGSECEDGETVVGAEVADVANHTATTVISPRAASNSRRKRKRKSSQSEKKQSSKSPPPVEEEEMMLRVNPSSPNPASPISITSPCSPENALASDCTPRSYTSTSCDTTTNSSTVADSSTTPTHRPAPQWVSTPTNKPSPQWVSIEKKRRNSNASQDRNSKGNDGNEEVFLVSRSNSVPAPNHHQQQQQKQVCQRQSSTTVTTPLSAPGNGTSQTKNTMKNNQTRTRLMNKFNAISSHPEAMDAKKFENDLNIENKSSTATVGSAPRGPWAHIGNEDLVGGSLREIMAKEKEIQQRNRQRMKRSSPPPQSHTDVSQASTAKKSQPIPVVKGHQKGNALPSPSNTSSSPASMSNPWKTPESAPPALSMRALIAEAEAENKHTKVMQPPVKVIDSRPAKRQPVIKPHQPVSFASIIKSQESESNRNKSPVNKALSLIQIEERAISELEKLYSAAENPDEYIVIKRCSKNPLEQELGKLPLDSPWSRELQ